MAIEEEREFLEAVASESQVDLEIVAKVWEAMKNNCLVLFCHEDTQTFYNSLDELKIDFAGADPQRVSLNLEYAQIWIKP